MNENNSAKQNTHPQDELVRVKCINCHSIFFIKKNDLTMGTKEIKMSCPFCDTEGSIVTEPNESTKTPNA